MQAAIIIEPSRRQANYWRDIWRYRELFFVLAWRDFAVRYRQTVIGVLWAIVRPVLTAVIFTVIFGKLAGLPSDGSVPYPLMVFAGMLPWTFFSTGLADASNSLINQANLISKVYFPRIVVPTATIAVSLVDFCVSLGVLFVLMAWYLFIPGWQIVFLPAFLLLAFLASIGPSLWIAAINVKYRDLRYVIPFVVQFGLYISPVGFSSSVVPAQWRVLYSLNPMVGVIDGFRWCLLQGQSDLYLPSLIISCLVTAGFLWLGVSRFRKMEKEFADLI